MGNRTYMGQILHIFQELVSTVNLSLKNTIHAIAMCANFDSDEYPNCRDISYLISTVQGYPRDNRIGAGSSYVLTTAPFYMHCLFN